MVYQDDVIFVFFLRWDWGTPNIGVYDFQGFECRVNYEKGNL